VSILLEAQRKCPLLKAIGAAIEKVEADGLIEPADDLDQHVLSFIKQRLSFSLANRESLRQDLVAAVISHPCDDIVDLRARALALQEFSQDEQFEALTTGLKRASNILKGQAWGELNNKLLVEAQEQRLFEEIVKIEDDVYQFIAGCKYLDAFRLIAGLRPFIDDFFDHVMVMVDDENVRRNRLALLARLTKMFGSIADFSKIVVERK
jgi:glycyl-tRNA synthetase beta chain